jgi:hypothetical protein
MQQNAYGGNSDKSPVNTGTSTSGKANVLNQQADLSAIMLFNTDRRFSITE